MFFYPHSRQTSKFCYRCRWFTPVCICTPRQWLKFHRMLPLCRLPSQWGNGNCHLWTRATVGSLRIYVFTKKGLPCGHGDPDIYASRATRTSNNHDWNSKYNDWRPTDDHSTTNHQIVGFYRSTKYVRCSPSDVSCDTDNEYHCVLAQNHTGSCHLMASLYDYAPCTIKIALTYLKIRSRHPILKRLAVTYPSEMLLV